MSKEGVFCEHELFAHLISDPDTICKANESRDYVHNELNAPKDLLSSLA